MAAPLNANLRNFFIQWPDHATLTLIVRRRAYQHEFATTPINLQRRLWVAISRDINNAHPNFAPTSKQCRSKWNSLKSGYENLERLMNGNPQRFPTRAPTMHDEHFHEEMSDELWTVERNYLTDSFINSLHVY